MNQDILFDMVIKEALIPDFKNMCFIEKNVGVKDGIIAKISDDVPNAYKVIDAKNCYLTPGLIDAHCHIESSHLLPSVFGDEIAKHGTLFAVCDCHEIANVKGRKGLEFFISESKNTLCNLKFAVPSCVPATNFATSGGKIDLEDVEYFLNLDEVVSLGEIMNVPAVVNRDEKFMKMIELAKRYKKRVNGHAPHLSHNMLYKYVSAGIEDDHESETYEELKEKLEMGLSVFIREGSAEKTENGAYKIIKEFPDRVMFCSDDKTAGDIVKYGHMDYNLKKAVSLGIEPIFAVKAATYNGLKYYGLDEFSEIKEKNRAYMVLFDEEFMVKTVIAGGKTFQKKEKSYNIPDEFLHTIRAKTVKAVPSIEHNNIAIGVTNGSLITQKLDVDSNLNEFDLKRDILKLCVFERYGGGNKSACRIKGFGLKKGAIASSLAHDCHNIIAVGTSDYAIKTVVDEIIKKQGGLALYNERQLYFLSLKVGGIVSIDSVESVVKQAAALRVQAKAIGCVLDNAFAALSFMALEVIPHLKLTDRGLFDVDNFGYLE